MPRRRTSSSPERACPPGAAGRSSYEPGWRPSSDGSQPSPRRSTPTEPAADRTRTSHQGDHRRRDRRRRLGRFDRSDVGADGRHRGTRVQSRDDRGVRAGGAAADGDLVVGDGDPTDGVPKRAREASLGCRDARVHERDLHRQDGHVDPERDDRPRDLLPIGEVRDRRHRIRAGRRGAPSRGNRSRTSAYCARCSCRQGLRAMPAWSSATGDGRCSATRRRRRSSSRAARRASISAHEAAVAPRAAGAAVRLVSQADEHAASHRCRPRAVREGCSPRAAWRCAHRSRSAVASSISMPTLRDTRRCRQRRHEPPRTAGARDRPPRPGRADCPT